MAVGAQGDGKGLAIAPGTELASDFTHILQATDGAITVPGGDFLLSADFVRLGPDLLLVGADGTRILIQGYFTSEHPPDLQTEGGARIGGDLAGKLAGPEAPGPSAASKRLKVP